MKKYLVSLLLLVLVFTSCEPNQIGDFDESKVPDFVIDTKVNKKRVCFTTRYKDWSHRTSALGAHWMYSWGTELRDEIPENVEFVPMFWGKSSVNDANIARIKQLVAEGKVKYILGFNEPDGAAQANMTVDEAIALWPRLEEIGVPIGSPATVNPNNAWMIEFMQKAEALNLRVDFVAVHHYGSDNVNSMINKLKLTYKTFKRPIWITEFAVADWAATSAAANNYSKEEVVEFMKVGLKALDEIEWIHRYSWFSGTQAPLFTSALYDDNDEITSPGQTYADHTPNPIIGPGTDTTFRPVVDPDEMVVNGGFESGMVAPWLGFKNGATTTDPKTGGFCGVMQSNDASLYTSVDVTAGKTYIIKYSTKWASAVTNTYSPALRNDLVAGTPGTLKVLDPVAKTATWTDYTTEYTIPVGVTKLRISFYKGQVSPTFPASYIDDISIKEKK